MKRKAELSDRHSWYLYSISVGEEYLFNRKRISESIYQHYTSFMNNQQRVRPLHNGKWNVFLGFLD